MQCCCGSLIVLQAAMAGAWPLDCIAARTGLACTIQRCHVAPLAVVVPPTLVHHAKLLWCCPSWHVGAVPPGTCMGWGCSAVTTAPPAFLASAHKIWQHCCGISAVVSQTMPWKHWFNGQAQSPQNPASVCVVNHSGLHTKRYSRYPSVVRTCNQATCYKPCDRQPLPSISAEVQRSYTQTDTHIHTDREGHTGTQ